MQLRLQENRHLVYPKNGRHADLASHPLTDITTLVDVVSPSNKQAESKVVQVMSRLEKVQVAIAKVKSLQDEEDRVADIEESALLKTEPEKARLAPALSELMALSKRFAALLAAFPHGDLTSAEFDMYKPLDFTRQITEILNFEVSKALDRWHSALESVCTRITQIVPDQWRERAVDEHDADFVKQKTLQQHLIARLDTDYLSASVWLGSLEKIVPAMDAF